MIKRLKDEAGYSLVEVMVSIMLLTIAIIPMVGMFDMGLNAATRASNYDTARALAKKQLEQSQSLSYRTVRTNFPNAPCSFDNSGLCEVENLEVPLAEDPDGEFDNFRYAIRKQFVEFNADATGFIDSDDGSDTSMMQITVEVGWGGDSFNDNIYTASDIKTR